jgi:acetyl esterase
MNAFPLILTLVTAGLAPSCSGPVAWSSAGNYVMPGVMGDVRYSSKFTLDAYAPQGEPRPAAVLIHGWEGNKRTHITPLFELLSRGGYAWFSIDYGSESDAAEAVRYIRCPGRFNITSDVTLIGEDTGAQVALDLAAGGGFRGVVGFQTRFNSGEPKRVPPNTRVLLIHGSADREAPSAVIEAYCTQLSKCEFLRVPGESDHFEHWYPEHWEWKDKFTAWLRGDRRGLWKDIIYARPGGRPLLMDAFIPSGRGPFPAVVMVHGGGFETGDKVTSLSPVFQALGSAGLAWFSIDYRLVPYVHLPEQLDDVRTAIRYVKEHSAWFHVDPDRLAILGESSGGHVVAQIASEPCAGCKVQAVVSFYGIYDLEAWSRAQDRKHSPSGWFQDSSPLTLRRFSPLFHVSSELPPILLIQGTADELYKGTLEYAAQLRELHANYELLTLDHAPHGMESWEGHPEWASYKDRLVAWLSEVLKAKTP